MFREKIIEYLNTNHIDFYEPNHVDIYITVPTEEDELETKTITIKTFIYPGWRCELSVKNSDGLTLCNYLLYPSIDIINDFIEILEETLHEFNMLPSYVLK